MLQLLLQATWQTLFMVTLAMVFGLLVGLPLAVALFVTAPHRLMANPWVHKPLSFLINTLRSLPYLILLVALLPVTRWLVGSSIGTLAASVPLGLAASVLIARVGQDAFQGVPKGLFEAALALGATRWQIITRVLIPEALPAFISGTLIVLINLIGFSAMAGAVGGGGLGDLAIRYGYQRYDVSTLLAVTAILIVMVQTLQSIGETLVRKLSV